MVKKNNIKFGQYRSLHRRIHILWAGCTCVGILAASALAQPGELQRLALPSTNVPDEWLTLAERSNFVKTPRYEETIRYCKRLANASPWVEYQSFGISPEGRELPLLVVSKDGAFTPSAARRTGKLIVYIQNGIHAGEIEGKDASLMLLRDIAITRTRANLLDHVILLVNPIFSVDGHERCSPYSRINQNGPEQMGWRTTSRNLNLNRDFIKADALEMRAFLRLWNAWQPDLHFDNHTTDGGDWQYDLTFTSDTHQTSDPAVAEWTNNQLYPDLFKALEADGHVAKIYFDMIDSKDLTKGIRSTAGSPRFSINYLSLRNRPSILVETHMLKPYRTRVICHYNIMLHTLEILNRDPRSLREVIRSAESDTIQRGKTYDPDRKQVLSVRTTEKSIPITFKGFAYRRELSEISGDIRIVYDNTKPIDIETVWFNEMEPALTVAPPRGYIIPPQWTEIIDLVRLHGLKADRLTESTMLDVQTYRFIEVKFPNHSYESRHMPRFKTERVDERRVFHKGSVIVWLDQADAKVAIHMFEPDAPDSLVRWGFMNAIFEQKEYVEHYVAESLARKMLANNPLLREEFEERIRTDRDFAASARARLGFFYRRSPYWDKALNAYPIARITTAITAPTQPLEKLDD